MLDRDNNHNGTCEFSSEIADYMYGEIEGSQQDNFEAHLPGCNTCTTDLAGISAVRLSVMEWRTAEFDVLQTPEITIPYRDAESETSIGWLAAVSGFFTASPGWATAAAVVPISLLCLGLVLFTFDIFGPVDVAQENNSRLVEPTSNRPSIQDSNTKRTENTLEVATPNAAQDNNSENTPNASDVISPSASKAVKVSEKNSLPTKSTRASDRGKTPQRTESPIPRQKAPRLNNFDDEEDDSLRLADLFAQTDTED